MVGRMSDVTSNESPGKAGAQRSRISQADVPSISLQKASRVPQALADNYASHPTRPLDVASALDMSPTSGPFRTICGAAVGYGLTDGGPNASAIALTALGKRVVAPTEVDDDSRALREAALKPTVASQFYKKYDGSPLPPKNIGQNVLATLSVPVDRTSDVYGLLLENARHVEFLKTIKDKDYLDIGGPLAAPKPSSDVTDVDDDIDIDIDIDIADEAVGTTGPAPAQRLQPTLAQANQPPAKNAIFVGHGGNRKPMEQLIKILNEYSIPHKQAINE